MKRLFAFLLATALLLGLAGCKSSTPPQFLDTDFELLLITPGKVHTDYSGIEIRIDSLNWQPEDGKTTLTVTWDNNTDLDAVYGAAYTIERLDGEEWVSCAKRDDLAFIAIAYELKAGRTVKESYNLTASYDVSSPGTYRFKTDCYVSENADKSTKCELIAEFTIGNIKCPDDSKQTTSQVQYCAQYIRTDGYQEGAQFPKVQIIDSLQELKDYYTAHKEIFNLERREKVYADTTIGFLDACDQYNEAFFEENYLLFVLLEEGSGSVRHEIRSITQTPDKKISITVDRKVPEAGTDDMAQWHIILEFGREIMVETPEDVQVYLDGNLAWKSSVLEPQTEGAFKKPPAGKLITPDGETSLHLGGYSWFCKLANGFEEATIADQAGRPLPTDLLETVTVNSKYAETVYAPVQGSSAYAPTNSLGYLLKLDWEVDPTSVTYTCWPEAGLQNSNPKEEAVIPHQDFSFYANPGSYVYEIVANWEDTGAGYHGNANYYVYIVEVNEQDAEAHTHGIASDAQTVDDPFIGYCGNTWTTLHIGEKEYSFMFGHSITLTDILINLDYDPAKLCNCLPEYTVDTEFALGYGINLTQGYARCEKGQADLTQEQINQITEIIEWAETTNCKYPLSS